MPRPTISKRMDALMVLRLRTVNLLEPKASDLSIDSIGPGCLIVTYRELYDIQVHGKLQRTYLMGRLGRMPPQKEGALRAGTTVDGSCQT